MSFRPLSDQEVKQVCEAPTIGTSNASTETLAIRIARVGDGYEFECGDHYKNKNGRPVQCRLAMKVQQDAQRHNYRIRARHLQGIYSGKIQIIKISDTRERIG